jgi:transposase
MRKHYSAEFKAKVALEAIKEESTLQELSQKYEVHPVQISQWKQHLLKGSQEIFERPNKKKDEQKILEKQNDQQLRKIGQLTIEMEFLKKKHQQIFGKSDP